MELPIVQVGDPILRQQAAPVSDDQIQSELTQQLIQNMRETLRGKGVALAAPQVGKSLRLIVVEDKADEPQELLVHQQREPVDFYVLINPELAIEDPTRVSHLEGCLSVACACGGGFRMLVPRASAVRARGKDDCGKPLDFVARGWHARILQHEVDHLDGVLCIDRMESRSFMTGNDWKKRWNTAPIDELRSAFSIRPSLQPQPARLHEIANILNDRLDERGRLEVERALAEFEGRVA